MSVYVGASNAKKEASQLYLGRDGTKSIVTEAYALQNDNVKQVYCFIPEPGQQVFTSSGTFTAPSGVKSVDVFLVGGGGSGGFGNRINDDKGQHCYIGYGGGGGYTKTVKGASVTAGTPYSIIVGSGGPISTGNNYTGGTSSALGYSITGGTSGKWTYDASSGNGGSGGGVGGMCDSTYWSSAGWQYGGNGGSNGSNGYYTRNTSEGLCTTVSWGSQGQGTTTRAFGESSGTLYAGGGASGRDGISTTPPFKGGSGGGGNGYAGTWDGLGTAATAGTSNTGGGGGGGYREYTGAYDRGPRNGGSGIVIIRWGY